MGVRSDVAIVMKEAVRGHLTPEIKVFLEEWGFYEQARVDESDITKDESVQYGRITKDDLGSLFIAEGVKWYHFEYDDIAAFYKYMNENHDPEDWLIVQACHDYPESTDGDEGEWHDNPFGLRKCVSVELAWD